MLDCGVIVKGSIMLAVYTHESNDFPQPEHLKHTL